MNNPPLAQLAEATVLNAVQSEFESLKGDHPIYNNLIYKIYGPYQRKDLRRHIIIYNDSNRITISYPKFIMECKLKRLLKSNEEIHHKNGLEFDDRLDNYEIVNTSKHRQAHKTNLPEFFKCSYGNIIELVGIKLPRFKSERKRFPNMKGPYCSKSCAGKYS